jgi:hypothetical protein
MTHLLLIEQLTLDGIPQILVFIQSWECKE